MFVEESEAGVSCRCWPEAAEDVLEEEDVLDLLGEDEETGDATVLGVFGLVAAAATAAAAAARAACVTGTWMPSDGSESDLRRVL